MKSLQWLQNVGCLKKRATNLWSLISCTFFCLRAPRRCTPGPGVKVGSTASSWFSAILLVYSLSLRRLLSPHTVSRAKRIEAVVHSIPPSQQTHLHIWLIFIPLPSAGSSTAVVACTCSSDSFRYPCGVWQHCMSAKRTEVLKVQYIEDYFRAIVTLCQNVTKDFINVLMSNFHTCSKGW